MDKNTKKIAITGGVVVFGIVGFIAFKKIRAKQQQKAAVKAIAKGGNKELGINIPEIARQLGLDLGFAYPWYDLRRTTENDLAAQILVLKVPKPYIPQLISAYAKVPETKGRNLQADLQKVLDNYNEVAYLFN